MCEQKRMDPTNILIGLATEHVCIFIPYIHMICGI